MSPETPINFAKWYWAVAGSATQVYSTNSGGYVPVADAAHQAWLQAGNAPTRISSEQELADFLGSQGLPLPPATTLSDPEKTRQLGGLPTAVMRVLFNHENRIRALEGKAAVNQAQFLNALKALL